MIRTSPNLTHRAAALVAAAVLSFTTHHASAQQTVDLFGGTLGTPAMLSLVGNGVSTNQSTSGAFGPGYNGTASFGVATVSNLTEGFTSLTTGPNATNSFYVNQTGILGVAGATTATKTFGVSLTPGATYALTLTRTTGFTVGLLGSVNVILSAGGTPFVNTATNPGALGIADVLSLFGTNNTATFQFTVPSTATGTLGVNLSTTETANVLTGTYTFQSATISQVVPEPRTVVTLLLGAFGLALLRFRHRLQVI